MEENSTSQEAVKENVLAPWGGELGWMVATWIPYLRLMSKKYNITVIVQKAYAYLYEDFAYNILYKKWEGSTDRWLINGKKPKLSKKFRKAYKGYRILSPRKERCHKGYKQGVFFKYGQGSPEPGYDVLIHARHIVKNDWIDKACHRPHNMSRKKWEEVVAHLKKKTSDIACIGTIDGSRTLTGVTDLRGISIKRLCGIMANSKVVIGESSGPLHLASHCGTPQVIITHSRFENSIASTNKKRYKIHWNPFGIKCSCVIHEKWSPPVEKIVGKVLKYI